MNVLGLNLCEGLPSSDGGAEVECVRSLRFGKMLLFVIQSSYDG